MLQKSVKWLITGLIGLLIISINFGWQTFRMNQIYKMNTQGNFLTGIGFINQAKIFLQEGNMNFGSIRASQIQQAINKVIHAMTSQKQKNVES